MLSCGGKVRLISMLANPQRTR